MPVPVPVAVPVELLLVNSTFFVAALITTFVSFAYIAPPISALLPVNEESVIS